MTSTTPNKDAKAVTRVAKQLPKRVREQEKPGYVYDIMSKRSASIASAPKKPEYAPMSTPGVLLTPDTEAGKERMKRATR